MSTPPPPTQAEIDNLINALANAQSAIDGIKGARELLKGYRDTRQTYAELVTTTKAELDALVMAARPVLAELSAAIQAVET